jgi:hypothetical protein
MTKEVNRKRPGKGWTSCPNNVIRDPDITSNAFRVLMVIHSFSDDFQFNSAYVQQCSGLGRDAYRAAVSQLTDKRLLHVKQTRVGGKFVWDYTTFPDSPCPEKPATVEPTLVEPATVEPATVDQGILRRPEQKTIREKHLEEDQWREVPGGGGESVVGKPKENPPRPPLDQWVLSEMSRFGYHVPVPVAANVATRTLGAMSRDYAEEYITDRLSELTGQPQKQVVRYILQDGPGWLERKLNPPPARKERNNKRQRERVVDPNVRKYEHPPEVIRAFELQMGLIKDDDA